VTAVRRAEAADAREVARLLHDFNTEFSEPTPGVAILTDRARRMLAEGEITVLLEAAMALARQAGATVIELNTSEDDTAAIALYESQGFTNREGRPDGPKMFFYEREL